MRRPLPLYVVVEKIVAPHENVPADWAVHGTTGYRFANVVNGVLVERGARARLDRAWRAFVGDEAEDFERLSREGRHAVMDGSLAGELTVLATALLRLAREDRRTRDFTLHALREALAEVVACFPVYRTYLIDKPSAQDRKFIDWAIGRARRRSLAADASVFDFLRRVLLGRPLPGAPTGLGDRYRAFARRLQQYTAPVVAKGIEDTALYRHHRLISVNDVGGDPDDFGLSVAAFHAANRDAGHALAACDAGDVDPRRQALGGRARAHRRDQRDAGGVAPVGAPLEPPEPAPEAQRRRRAGAEPQRRIPAVPDAGRQLAGRAARRCGAGGLRRAHRAGDAEVGARIEVGDQLDEPQRRLRGGAGQLRALDAGTAARPTCSSPTSARRPR